MPTRLRVCFTPPTRDTRQVLRSAVLLHADSTARSCVYQMAGAGLCYPDLAGKTVDIHSFWKGGFLKEWSLAA